MTKRGFLQSILGGSLISLPEVGKIELMRLQTGDTIVVSYSGPMSMEVQSRLRGRLKEAFPDNEVLVLSDGLELKVLKAS